MPSGKGRKWGNPSQICGITVSTRHYSEVGKITQTAQEAGIRFPVFLTRAVWDAYVTVPPGVTGQDEAGRAWDILWMTRFAIIRARPGTDRLPVALYVRNDNVRSRLVKLVAVCGPRDIDDPAPAITVMMCDED